MIHTIYGKTDLPRRQRLEDDQISQLIAVPEKLAPWALIAPPIWLAVHRLWWWLATYFLFVLLTSAIASTSFAVISMVISWLPGVYLLLEGRELYRRKLEDSGMTLLAVANGDSEDEAIGRYVQREMLDMPQLVIEPASASPRASLLQSKPSSSAQSVGTLGLFSAGDS